MPKSSPPIVYDIQNAFRYLSQNGPRGFYEKVKKQVSRRVELWSRDNELLGKYVELTGNRRKIEGLTFDLDNAFIARRLKSRFIGVTKEKGYENHQRMQAHMFVKPELPAIEFGACIGVLSCVTNKLLKNPSEHVVVEANPNLIPTLTKNRDLNGCGFEVVNAALAYGTETIEFFLHDFFVGGSVQRKTDQKTAVPAVTLKSVIERRGFDRINLLSNSEGAEFDMITQDAETLKKHVSIAIIEMHAFVAGEELIAKAHKQMEDMGFVFVEKRGISSVFRNSAHA